MWNVSLKGFAHFCSIASLPHFIMIVESTHKTVLYLEAFHFAYLRCKQTNKPKTNQSELLSKQRTMIYQCRLLQYGWWPCKVHMQGSHAKKFYRKNYSSPTWVYSSCNKSRTLYKTWHGTLFIRENCYAKYILCLVFIVSKF